MIVLLSSADLQITASPSILPKVLTHALYISHHFQAVTRFTNLADESPEVPKLRNKKYQDFKLDRADSKRLQLVYNVLKCSSVRASIL
ncbi:hypothetical protein AZE42_11052 [Rhizopogon vesiculosus]|uniref:Uncharacterized protein n=1 Tax=Rhizopogon vesiculosus TaxID=180088 RepID=A0A1J8QPN8_9AGAM|nr:hypothetical protein AZE42_11052 [Rhizopogon vesiculosus]